MAPSRQPFSDRLAHYSGEDGLPTQPSIAGKLLRVVGMTLEVVGLELAIGCRCLVLGEQGRSIEAEVVGFTESKLFLMPIEPVTGLKPGMPVVPVAYEDRVPVGMQLLGRVIDGAGRPLDGKGALGCEDSIDMQADLINPLERKPISTVLDVGIRAINSVLTVGRGQRLGLFAGSGVGKSVLLGMMTRFTEADVVVVGLVGERGREVKEFIEQVLDEEGLARSVVVASPADDAPLMRMRAAMLATRLAESFRDQGKHVLLLMDSLTRYAQAQREIALSIGEPPATKGYPPSVFAKIPQLVERAGNDVDGKGSVTAFYTVLTEGDDLQDPVADAARAILDGHVVLSRALADEGHYPAIDIEGSISRAMPNIISPEHLQSAQRLRYLYSRYQQSRDLISVGAYVAGSDPETDLAIERLPSIRNFLQQGLRESFTMAASVAELQTVLAPPKTMQADPASQQGRDLAIGR
ncbi:flagellar protein export ATPase FliI [Oceanicoccus sagamiensis]|uniref:Flagellum-specific ATP synthase n=1 Tax=Oceanicoccus sagamiensis TaxID=716816 RepID=A0A1X9NG89_9GAMM|nr:flagellar protein export ATPase FliI [Oceanicoccus sagamiensis]ARN75412.1 flagellum-specific ATP synthase FliI [Oceanicoccus sagamiensis]